jgi:MFS family permease
MLGALAPEGQRGRVFGYHRAMDHLGAVIGPILAAVFLWFFPEAYRPLFALTIVPGALALATVLFVPETDVATTLQQPTSASTAGKFQADAPSVTWRSPLGRFLLILLLFTLGNSADAFLLLRLSEAGLAVTYLPLAWSALHIVKSSLSTFGGTLSDRLGHRRMIVAGWVLYATVYAGFAWAESLQALIGWFLVYGVHFAMVEGSERALIADLTPNHLQGTAFGWYNAVLGMGALAASLLFGGLWETVGPSAAFLTGAGLAITAAMLLAADGGRDEPPTV